MPRKRFLSACLLVLALACSAALAQPSIGGPRNTGFALPQARTAITTVLAVGGYESRRVVGGFAQPGGIYFDHAPVLAWICSQWREDGTVANKGKLELVLLVHQSTPFKNRGFDTTWLLTQAGTPLEAGRDDFHNTIAAVRSANNWYGPTGWTPDKPGVMQWMGANLIEPRDTTKQLFSDRYSEVQVQWDNGADGHQYVTSFVLAPLRTREMRQRLAAHCDFRP